MGILNKGLKKIGSAVLYSAENINRFLMLINNKISNREIIKIVHVKTYDNNSIHYIYLVSVPIHLEISLIKYKRGWIYRSRFSI